MPAKLVFAIAVAVGVVTLAAVSWMLFDAVKQARRSKRGVRPHHDAF
jgi:hypothetical protein